MNTPAYLFTEEFFVDNIYGSFINNTSNIMLCHQQDTMQCTIYFSSHRCWSHVALIQCLINQVTPQ